VDTCKPHPKGRGEECLTQLALRLPTVTGTEGACRRDSRANLPVHEACASYTQEGSCRNSHANAQVSGGLEKLNGWSEHEEEERIE
jgi:hypothetical protein